MPTLINFGKLQGKIGILAEQELRTALAICAGLSTKEIAKAFGCAPGTAKKTIERIFFKFRVSSRTAMIAEAFRLGLISFASSAPVTPDPQGEGHQGDKHLGVFIA
ncbi:helix-turn-helix transcriptional regulator [Pseudomonas ogarae]|uniref:response regulator transcription factor n=1 Tax=Pseudomonas ogarae (strain DSM 112162 / CECT 30235 / F113) TaxID=1114970 RepID=UPI001647509C|nr:helix-turn-helix transcriptional regulator [Pseudomonas zarinae]QXH96084.1 helix-turn-helix transcriptional regulator [Pseudomonas zarinae]